MELNERTVGVVTGGASGLGEATARMLVNAGARVAVFDLEHTNGEQLAKELGDSCLFVPVDISEAPTLEAAVAQVAEEFGRIDLCVNCAGVPNTARVLSRDGTLFPLDLYRHVIDVNLVGLFDVIRHVTKAMSHNEPNEDGERGAIVNVASIAAFDGQAGQAAYSASKAGIVGMTLPLARDLASFGIRVVTVCPGIFETNMLAEADDKIRRRLLDIPVFPHRLGQPVEFAHLVRCIAENVMLNGEVIRLDAATRLPHG